MTVENDDKIQMYIEMGSGLVDQIERRQYLLGGFADEVARMHGEKALAQFAQDIGSEEDAVTALRNYYVGVRHSSTTEHQQ